MTTTASTLTTTVLRAEGFSCPSCVAKIEKSVGRVPGVAAVKVYFASARIEIRHDLAAALPLLLADPAVADVEQLVAAVAKAGYTARPAAF